MRKIKCESKVITKYVFKDGVPRELYFDSQGNAFLEMKDENLRDWNELVRKNYEAEKLDWEILSGK